MGLFDYVQINDARFTCSEGHALSGMEFQSKDFGCAMGSVSINEGVVTTRPGYFGVTPSPDYAEVEVYGDCTQCPAFVQDGTGNLIACWVEFEIVIKDDRVTEVNRISPATCEWLETEPRRDHMKDCEGPMSYQEARDLHIQYSVLRPERVQLHHERWKKWRAELDAKAIQDRPVGPTKP